MRKAPHLVAGFAALLSSTLFTASSSGSSGAAVTVNGQAISRALVLEKIEQHPEARQALGHLIGETLVNQYAEQHHIVVTDAEVAARERELRAQFPGKKWNDMLAVRNIPDSGMPTLVRTELQLDKIVANDVRVSDADVRGYYEKHRALYEKTWREPRERDSPNHRLVTRTTVGRVQPRRHGRFDETSEDRAPRSALRRYVQSAKNTLGQRQDPRGHQDAVTFGPAPNQVACWFASLVSAPAIRGS